MLNMRKIIVVSSFPGKKEIHGKNTVGVASYAKNTLVSIKKAAGKDFNISVLAEKIDGEENYTQKDIEVKRVWKRNSFRTFPSLLKEILKSKVDVVALEFELAMFGELPYLLPFPLFILILKLLRKKTFMVLHQVVPDVESIGPHVNIETHTLKGTLFSLGLPLFYTFLLSVVTKIVVFEQSLKDKLSRYGNTKNVAVIPHGVEIFTKIPTKSASRKKLGIKRSDFVIVSFGYLAWYKGTDWILHALEVAKKKKKNRNIRLILAGGPNPNHMDKSYYTKYIDSITQKAMELNVEVTGFVPENHIAEYFQAADVIVLPYRTHMSASGPLSMAFAFKKPFLLSSQLKYVMGESDVIDLLKKMRIAPQKVIFKEPEDFSKKLMFLRKNRVLQHKLSSLSKELSKTRSWDNVGRMYLEELSI